MALVCILAMELTASVVEVPAEWATPASALVAGRLVLSSLSESVATGEFTSQTRPHFHPGVIIQLLVRLTNYIFVDSSNACKFPHVFPDANDAQFNGKLVPRSKPAQGGDQLVDKMSGLQLRTVRNFE